MHGVYGVVNNDHSPPGSFGSAGLPVQRAALSWKICERGMNRTKNISKHVLTIFLIGAGTMHFVAPKFYLKIMPPYLPWHDELVLLSGVCEILLGIMLAVPSCSRQAAWGIILLLVAVFPANLHVYQHQELIPGTPVAHLLRLPLQALLMLWAWWHTKPSRANAATETRIS